MTAETWRRLVPSGVRKQLRAYKDRTALKSLLRDWTLVGSQILATPGEVEKPNILIVSTDPWHIVGSLGDDAMISATLAEIHCFRPNARFTVITASDSADSVAAKLGLKSVRIWNAPDFVGSILECLTAGHFSNVVVVGADVLDGHYGALGAAKLLVVADLAARMRIPSTVLGFSFNSAPRATLTPFFNGLHDGVRLNVRDPISMDRLTAFSSATKYLASDVALLLRPKPVEASDPALMWLAERRREGRPVLGFNVHPMLIDNASAEDIRNIIDASTRAIETSTMSSGTSWMLIPHDHRPSVGDEFVLTPLSRQLAQSLGDKVFYLEGQYPAASLKYFTSRLDGVVSGRMHLAIAALSSGIPVLAITYQDKFEGLFQHFNLPSWLLATPAELLNTSLFSERLEQFLLKLPELTDTVTSAVGRVRSLALSNFDGIRPAELPHLNA